MHYHSEALIRDLSARAQAFRIQVLKMVHSVQSGHIGGAFSCAEILAALYFHHLRIDPADPDWPARDRLLFSKGHACAMLYTCLAHRGFFPVEELMIFRRLDSRLQGHPDRLRLPGMALNLAKVSNLRKAQRPRRAPRPPASTSCWATARSTPAWFGRV